VLAGLLLIVLFLGLALIIVMFGVVPRFSNLMQGPTPRPVAITLAPGSTRADTTRQPSLPGTAVPPPRPTAPATVTPRPDPTAAVKADALVKKMLTKEGKGLRYRFITWGTYSLEAPSRNINPVTLRIDGEVDGNDSRTVMTTAEQTGDRQLSQLESRVVDGVSYFYVNGQWQTASSTQAGIQQRFFRDPVDFLDSAVRLTYLGVEQLPDVPVPTYKYWFEMTSGQLPIAGLSPELPPEAVPALETQQGGYLWLGTDGRRYRLEYGMRLRTPREGLTLGWDLVTQYYDYDDPSIRIEAPQGVAPGG
jgi:hypothetical protein